MTPAFIAARIEATQAQIIAYEDAILALTVNGVASYELDTGQTVTKVTKHNLRAMQTSLDSLYNRCVTLGIRANGSGGFIGRPGF